MDGCGLHQTSGGVAWGDYNDDRYLDIYWSSTDYDADNVLFRNNGDGTFTDVTAEAGVGILEKVIKANSQGSPNWVDFDNDGDLDLFRANEGDINFLFSNNGDGTFNAPMRGILIFFSAIMVMAPSRMRQRSSRVHLQVSVFTSSSRTMPKVPPGRISTTTGTWIATFPMPTRQTALSATTSAKRGEQTLPTSR